MSTIDETTLQMWKNKHRKVFEVVVTDDDQTFTGYFKRPDMDTIAAVNKISKTDEVKAATTLFCNCWLGGDVMIQEDAIVKMAAIGKLQLMMNGCVAEIKNV